MVGVAVKVTLVPAHIVLPGAAAIDTLTGKLAFTVIVIVFDVAVVVVIQVPPVTVISQVTWSLLASVDDAYVFDALLCTLEPFTLKS